MESGAARAWSTARPGADREDGPWCIAPWVSLEFDPAGRVYTCCANQLYPVGRIGDDRLAELWHGPRLAVLRDAMRRWDTSVGCATCRWHVEHGRLDPDAAVYDRFDVDLAATAGPVSMTFALSNRCNLGCVMCSPELSSTLRHGAGLPPLPSPYGDQFFADLEPMLAGLRYAKFLGGEPFLIQEHHRVWDLMAAVGPPPRIQVTTNGTIWNDRVEWLLDTFSVDVTVSIDAVDAATYASIRRGAQVEVVLANLSRFAAACAAAGTELRLCFCLMVQNSDELHPVLELADRLGAPVSVNLVTDEGFSLHQQPLEALDEVAARWARMQRLEGPNRAVWAVQVAQLDQVRSELRSGHALQPRRATPPPPDFLGSAILEVAPGPDVDEGLPADHAPAEVELERARLAAWAADGWVAELVVTVDGIVDEVVVPHHELGIDASVEGASVDDLVREMELARTRDAWLVDRDLVAPGLAVRTLVLSAETPVRGATGVVVRVVAVRAGRGARVLIAQDLVYDSAPTSVPVTEVDPPIRRPADRRG